MLVVNNEDSFIKIKSLTQVNQCTFNYTKCNYTITQSVIDRGHSEMCFSLSTDKYIKVAFCSLNRRKKKLYPFLLTKCRGRI